MNHGDKYLDENGNEFMVDYINGCDWHVPNSSTSVINEDGSWNDEWPE